MLLFYSHTVNEFEFLVHALCGPKESIHNAFMQLKYGQSIYSSAI